MKNRHRVVGEGVGLSRLTSHLPDPRAALAALAAFVLMACGSSSAPTSSASSGPLPVIRYGAQQVYNPVFLGVAHGFFKQAGVDVQIVSKFTGGAQAVQAAGSGSIDMGEAAIPAIINGVKAGVPIKGVADWQSETAAFPLQRWYVLSDSSIHSVSDLKGKRIGVNSLGASFYYTMAVELQKFGMTIKDVKFVVLAHNLQEQALRAKQIDVAGLIDPYTLHIEHGGGVRTLFTGYDALGQREISLVFARNDFRSAHAKEVAAFLKGWRATIAYIEANPQKSSQEMATALGLDSADVGAHSFQPNATVVAADAQFWIDTMTKLGVLPANAGLSASDIDAS